MSKPQQETFKPAPSPSEAVQMGYDLSEIHDPMKLAQAFLGWTRDILPTLGFLELRINLGVVGFDPQNYPMFGVKSIVALSSTTNTLEFKFAPDPINGNPYHGPIVFNNNGNTCNEVLLAFWIKTLYRYLFCFDQGNWLRMNINLTGWSAGY